MIHWVRVHVESATAWGSAAAIVAAHNLADSLLIRNIIAVGAAVAALAVIWTKLIKPALEYARLPDRMDALEELTRLNGIALAEIQRTIESRIIGPPP